MSHDGTILPESVERLFHLDAGRDCPFHIAAATLKADAQGKRRVVSGRGPSKEDAVRNCLYEAGERQSAIFSERRPLMRASAHDLGAAALPPRDLLLISPAQYRDRADWNGAIAPDHHLPAPFDMEAQVGWVEAQSLRDAAKRWVPAACCFLGYPTAIAEGFPVPDSSGLASGTAIADAVDRALLECIERDAVAIWWYNRLPRPAADVGDLALWHSFTAWAARWGRTTWLLDLTHDLATPVIAAISCNEHGSDLSLGFGAAHDLGAAATQAMGELVQFELTKRTFPDVKGERYPHLVSWCRSARVADHPFLRPDPAAKAVHPRPRSTLTDRLDSAGLEAFAVDLSSDGSMAAKVLVPGLRSIWPRHAPGRLYDVPVALGWLKEPHAESGLNPVPILY